MTISKKINIAHNIDGKPAESKAQKKQKYHNTRRHNKLR